MRFATESGPFSQFFIYSCIWRGLVSAPRVLIVQRDYCVYVFQTLSWTDVLLNMYCAYFLKSIQMRFLCHLNSSVAFNGVLFSKGACLSRVSREEGFPFIHLRVAFSNTSSRGRYNSGDEAEKVAH